MPIAIELQTTCERCRDPLPLNAWGTRATCWACLHENPVSPEEWAQLLRGAIEDAWTMEAGEGRTETLRVGTRTFSLRWSVPERVRGRSRKRPREMRQDLFPGVRALAGEEGPPPPSTENVPFTCPQCGGSLTITGRSREVHCSFCNTRSMLSDEVWRRLHPVHARRPWFLILDDDDDVPAPEEDPGEMPAKAARADRPVFPPLALVDAVTGAEGLVYGTGTMENRPVLVCLDAELRIRWRADVRHRLHGWIRVALVGAEVWLVDGGRHEVQRFSRATGEKLGKLGGEEPAGAKVHHLDVRGACDVAGCPDGSVLVLVCHRIVRYNAQGQGVLTWPPVAGIWAWFNREHLFPLYKGPPVEDDGQTPHIERRFAEVDTDHLGQDRPTRTLTVTLRLAVGPGGDLWFFDGSRVLRYGPDGRLRFQTRLQGYSSGLPSRPLVDNEGNCWVVAQNGRGDSALLHVSPSGQHRALPARNLGASFALSLLPSGEIVVWSTNEGEVRVLDREGRPVRASAAAVDSDRSNAEDDSWQDEDDG